MAFRAEIADFAAFYEATYQRAYRTALAIVGEPGQAADATQDAYLEAFRSRGGFRGDAPAEVWLMRIVVNRAITITRRRRVRWLAPLPAELGGGPDEPARLVDRVSILDELAALAPEQRTAIVLRYYLDYDYAAIARIMDAPVGTVGSWLSRGLDRLGVALDPDLAPEMPAEEVADVS